MPLGFLLFNDGSDSIFFFFFQIFLPFQELLGYLTGLSSLVGACFLQPAYADIQNRARSKATGQPNTSIKGDMVQSTSLVMYCVVWYGTGAIFTIKRETCREKKDRDY